WKGVPVDPPDTAALKGLARVWLEKNLTRKQLKEVLEESKGFSKEELANRPADADEQLLLGPLDDDKLMTFVGRKAINNYGCYGCHNIPGFETAKPIGTGLNDWGKKDPDRLAFEDSVKYVREHFDIADVRRDLTDAEKEAGGEHVKPWEGKKSYERFFADAL